MSLSVKLTIVMPHTRWERARKMAMVVAVLLVSPRVQTAGTVSIIGIWVGKVWRMSKLLVSMASQKLDDYKFISSNVK